MVNKNLIHISTPKPFIDPKNRGKYMARVASEFFASTTSDGLDKKLEKAKQKHPRAMVEYYFSPKGLLVV